MNRVLEVDEYNAICLVEPGVSYFDMYRHLKETGSKLWIDVPDPGWGSLIGNALDHGGGYTAPAYRNHFEAHCGMEIVLADGEILRTGMGGLPGAKTWQQYKFGYGPSLDGLFKQSNYGVVTKMGFWLFPEPEAYFSGTVMTPRHDDIVKIVEIFNYLENTMAVHGLPSMYSQAYPDDAADRSGTPGAALGARGPGSGCVAGLGRAQGSAVLDLLAQVLRRAQCRARAVGRGQGALRGHTRREVQGRRTGSAAARRPSRSRACTSRSSASRAWRCSTSARARKRARIPPTATSGSRRSSRAPARR